MSPEDIAVVSARTPNVRALLSEIAARLGALLERGEEHAIDLRALPLVLGERDALRDALGRGEIAIRVDALGESEILETGIAGVWWATHRGEAGEVSAELIEIGWQPALLASHPADVAAALACLRERLEAPENSD
jgi:hypothetical protein